MFDHRFDIYFRQKVRARKLPASSNIRPYTLLSNSVIQSVTLPFRGGTVTSLWVYFVVFFSPHQEKRRGPRAETPSSRSVAALWGQRFESLLLA